jgi:hypothetical protein
MPFERVQSSRNLAALMAPEDQRSAHLQSVGDSDSRWMCRLINAFEKTREGMLQKKML